MKQLPLVEIYIKINFTNEKIGSYTSLLKYKDRIEILRETSMIDKTPNRILIRAIIESIKNLKVPSNIILNTQTSWGFKNILNKDGSIKTQKINTKYNEDLKNEVRELIIRNNHNLNSILNKNTNNIVSNSMNKITEKGITDRQKKYLERLMKYSNKRIREKDIDKCKELHKEIERVGIDNLTLQSARQYIAIFVDFEKNYIRECELKIKSTDNLHKVINLDDYR